MRWRSVGEEFLATDTRICGDLAASAWCNSAFLGVCTRYNVSLHGRPSGSLHDDLNLVTVDDGM